MSEHTFTIKLQDGQRVIQDPSKRELWIGDTVRYVTEPPNLEFKVEFDASPFSSAPSLTIDDSKPLTVKERGKFSSRCFVKGPDGNFIGCTPDAGGEHDVRP